MLADPAESPPDRTAILTTQATPDSPLTAVATRANGSHGGPGRPVTCWIATATVASDDNSSPEPDTAETGAATSDTDLAVSDSGGEVLTPAVDTLRDLPEGVGKIVDVINTDGGPTPDGVDMPAPEAVPGATANDAFRAHGRTDDTTAADPALEPFAPDAADPAGTDATGVSSSENVTPEGALSQDAPLSGPTGAAATDRVVQGPGSAEPGPMAQSGVSVPACLTMTCPLASGSVPVGFANVADLVTCDTIADVLRHGVCADAVGPCRYRRGPHRREEAMLAVMLLAESGSSAGAAPTSSGMQIAKALLTSAVATPDTSLQRAVRARQRQGDHTWREQR